MLNHRFTILNSMTTSIQTNNFLPLKPLSVLDSGTFCCTILGKNMSMLHDDPFYDGASLVHKLSGDNADEEAISSGNMIVNLLLQMKASQNDQNIFIKNKYVIQEQIRKQIERELLFGKNSISAPNIKKIKNIALNNNVNKKIDNVSIDNLVKSISLDLKKNLTYNFNNVNNFNTSDINKVQNHVYFSNNINKDIINRYTDMSSRVIRFFDYKGLYPNIYNSNYNSSSVNIIDKEYSKGNTLLVKDIADSLIKNNISIYETQIDKALNKYESISREKNILTTHDTAILSEQIVNNVLSNVYKSIVNSNKSLKFKSDINNIIEQVLVNESNKMSSRSYNFANSENLSIYSSIKEQILNKNSNYLTNTENKFINAVELVNRQLEHIDSDYSNKTNEEKIIEKNKIISKFKNELKEVIKENTLNIENQIYDIVSKRQISKYNNLETEITNRYNKLTKKVISDIFNNHELIDVKNIKKNNSIYSTYNEIEKVINKENVRNNVLNKIIDHKIIDNETINNKIIENKITKENKIFKNINKNIKNQKESVLTNLLKNLSFTENILNSTNKLSPEMHVLNYKNENNYIKDVIKEDKEEIINLQNIIKNPKIINVTSSRTNRNKILESDSTDYNMSYYNDMVEKIGQPSLTSVDLNGRNEISFSEPNIIYKTPIRMPSSKDSISDELDIKNAEKLFESQLDSSLQKMSLEKSNKEVKQAHFKTEDNERLTKRIVDEYVNSLDINVESLSRKVLDRIEKTLRTDKRRFGMIN